MICLPLLFAMLPGAVGPAKIDFFIGTYTSPNGSRGIYRASIDSATGQLSTPLLAVESSNPSYVALSPDGRFLYAVHEEDHGSVSAFKVKGDSLEFLNTQPVSGSAPCDLSVDPLGKNLLVACYVGGIISCLPITDTGSLSAPSAEIPHTGGGPDKSRQDGPHMHWIQADAKAKFVYTCDLGSDKVRVYQYTPDKGALTLSDEGTGMAPAGDGPRHGTFDAAHRFLYVNNEMGNSVTAFTVDPATGGLKAFQTIGTLPKDVAAHKALFPLITTAEIEMHPSGKWLYVSNRGHNSISQFKISLTGELSRVATTVLKVTMPRGFGIDPSGRWLVAAGQDSNNLASYEIDPASGALTLRSHVEGVGKPVCIVFAPQK